MEELYEQLNNYYFFDNYYLFILRRPFLGLKKIFSQYTHSITQIYTYSYSKV